MEEPQQETGVGVESPFSFPPHRRPLRSGTYRNLVRVLSLFYGDSPLATAPPIIPLPQEPDNGSNRGELSGDDAREPGWSVITDCRQAAILQAQLGKVGDGGFEDSVCKGYNDTQMVIDQIEHMMQIEGTGFQDEEIGQGQMLMAELENIMKGNEDCDKSSNYLTMSLDQNQGNNCVGLMNNLEENNDRPAVDMEESGKVGLPHVDMEGGNQSIIEAFGFSSNGCLTVGVSKSCENVENQSSFSMANMMHEKIEIQQKEKGLEKFVCSNDQILSPDQMVEGGEIEEGEIFGDIQLVNESIGIIPVDAVVSEEKVEEKQVSGSSFGDKYLQCNEQSTANNKGSELTLFNRNAQFASGVTEGKIEGSERDQMVSELGRMHREEGNENTLKQSGRKDQVIKSKKKDDDVCNRKRHSPSPADKKEKKKRNKRKKRAEKNRQLGVKRPKVSIVLNKKPVQYCRHYLKGRCYEGEKCKFSHDTVPLTKSQPCSYFAHNSCMKGDDCPFDHQLSKYPCNNYLTLGVCSRGDNCLFSHKMSAELDVASLPNARELSLKSSLQGDSDMGLNINGASHKNVDSSSCSVGALSQKGKKQIAEETPTKTPELARSVVKSHFVSKSSMVESSKLYQGSSQKMNEGGRFGKSKQSTSCVNSRFASKPSLAESSKLSQGRSSPKMNENSRLWSQANQSESGTIQNVNDGPKRRPGVVPRGINFLSFGKSLLEDSPSKGNLSLNKGDGYKQHPNDSKGDKGQLNHQITQSLLSSDQKRTHPAQLPLEKNFLSFGKPANSGSNAQASLPSSSDNINNGLLQNSNYAADKLHNSSSISCKFPVSSQTLGQSSEWSAHKNTPNTAQKAIVSSLAVAKLLNEGKSVYESQNLSDKQYNSNANPWKMPTSPFSTGQISEKTTHKNTPISAQKALMSTIAFAAKFESGLKKNQSAVITGVNSESNNSRIGEGSKNDSSKTSKLLDILSSVGSKINKM